MSAGDGQMYAPRRAALRVSDYAGRALVVLCAFIAALAAILLAQPTSAATHSVDIVDFSFQPSSITIDVGDSVTWTNRDGAPHTATERDHEPPTFDTGGLGTNQSKTITFNTPGSFNYFCEIHPSMQGMLIVEEPTPTVTITVTPIADPIPAPIEQGDLTLDLAPVASGLAAPNWGVSAPGDPQRLFVTDQNGMLWALDLTTGVKTMFGDFRSLLVPLGIRGTGTYDERGLLGMAFHPDYAVNGLLYTYTSEPARPNPDFSTMPTGVAPDHENVVREWHVDDPGDAESVVDPASSRVLLRSYHPQFNHNGGALNFGPDKMLYIAIGDGGNADDQGPGHGPEGNGQRMDTVLGKLLRIDPLGRTGRNGQYAIPSDNPFVGQAGALPEIYAYGFRNPWRFSFDRTTGTLIAADVGQNAIEEINIVEKGKNYGWRVKEGTFLFTPNGDGAGFVFKDSPGQPTTLRDPIAQYDHDEGIAITGGFVYRGTAIPELRGRYVFGDFARTFTGSGRLFYLTETNRIAEVRLPDQAELGIKLDGFGQDARGELYVLGNTTGTPFGTTGVVLKLVAAGEKVYLPLVRR